MLNKMKRYKPKTKGSTRIPKDTVSLMKNGILNFGVHHRKHFPLNATVEIWYDEENKIVVLKPTDKPNPYTIRIRSHNKHCTSRMITLSGLSNRLNLKKGYYSTEWSNKKQILIIDFSKPKY